LSISFDEQPSSTEIPVVHFRVAILHGLLHIAKLHKHALAL
jgi:hypothetical protein